MATISFPSLPKGDLVEIELLKIDGSAVSRKLLVDSGFTGQSHVILPLADLPLRTRSSPLRRRRELSREFKRVVW